MSTLRHIMQVLHRVIGVITGILLTIWFISGLVLIYKPFPAATEKEQIAHSAMLDPSDLQPMDSVWQISTGLSGKVQAAWMVNEFGRNTWHIKSEDREIKRISSGDISTEAVTAEDCDFVARQWCDAPVVRIDTLQRRDQWTMYTRYLNNLPMLLYRFGDKSKTWVYVDSKTAQVVQQSTRAERLWSWFGSIPHKFYFRPLREHTQTWISVLSICAALAALDILLGFVLGVRLLVIRRRRTGRWGSPYRRKSYYWHHVLGLIFGIFLFTWAFSGAVALQKIPDWVVGGKNSMRISADKIYGRSFHLADYKLDYRDLFIHYNNIKRIDWLHVAETPFYKITTADSTYFVDASAVEKPKPLNISKQQWTKVVKRIHGTDVPISVKLLEDYDRYYLSAFGALPLPVYRFEVEDGNGSLYYFNPANGDYRYLDQKRKVKRWIFSELHFLQYKLLIKYPAVWTIVIWFLVLGCIVTSLTGVWLSFVYLKRSVKKYRKKK
ncbi:hypothetical protein HQ47_01630 [Porphyromonas macacae]|uniref:PepSY domain-containing protein n=2 Tax=Porphyromonas macacae TaxID=28115 RepID=A0A0A2E9U5_9PORP|nr:hypothetical protein HQ47_01630 [Porphyromonas macacae]